MLAVGKLSSGGGYQYRYTKWTEEVDTSGFTPETLSVYGSQEEALQDIAETSAALRDHPDAQEAADMMDFVATLSNAVFLMRKEYPDQWESMERELASLDNLIKPEDFVQLSAELDKLSIQ